MSSVEILQLLRDTYAAARTYRDTGYVSIIDHEDGTEEVVGRFQTEYFREQGICFEYTSPAHSRLMVRTDGSNLVEFHDVTPSDRSYTLGGAIACITGVTNGTAHTIPCLLLPSEIPGRRPWDAATAGDAREGLVDGHPCWTIELLRGQQSQELSISRIDSTLRRIVGRPVPTADLIARAQKRGFQIEGMRIPMRMTTYEPSIVCDAQQTDG